MEYVCIAVDAGRKEKGEFCMEASNKGYKTMEGMSGSTAKRIYGIVVSWLVALATVAIAANPITDENALTGSPASEWDISGAGDSTIQGFATDISVNKGETVR